MFKEEELKDWSVIYTITSTEQIMETRIMTMLTMNQAVVQKIELKDCLV